MPWHVFSVTAPSGLGTPPLPVSDTVPHMVPGGGAPEAVHTPDSQSVLEPSAHTETAAWSGRQSE